jgi:hypothetical protein
MSTLDRIARLQILAHSSHPATPKGARKALRQWKGFSHD